MNEKEHILLIRATFFVRCSWVMDFFHICSFSDFISSFIKFLFKFSFQRNTQMHGYLIYIFWGIDFIQFTNAFDRFVRSFWCPKWRQEILDPEIFSGVQASEKSLTLLAWFCSSRKLVRNFYDQKGIRSSMSSLWEMMEEIDNLVFIRHKA